MSSKRERDLTSNKDFDLTEVTCPDGKSADNRLNKLLKNVTSEVRRYAEDQIKHMSRLAQIGLALSAEKDIRKLLEMIVDEARDLSNADAGTLYTLDSNRTHLKFEILQNESMNTRMGGGDEIGFPMVPLYIDGEPNYKNVSSYAALKEEIVNIPDVYQAQGFDFTGPIKYDSTTGYRSQSMLVIPMKNHENDIIGVLQLLNAQDDESGKIIPFSPEYVDLIASLASQAAVALTNAQLVENLKTLFDSFIRSIATAIDEKSPYTGGHIKRVVDLSMMIAEKINRADRGPFKDVRFDEDQLEELRLSAWMHDIGKITTPEWVVDKSSKLETILDRMQLIELRFQLIEKTIENAALQKTVESGQSNEAESRERIRQIRRDLEFIRACNQPGEFMSNEKVDRLKRIAEKKYVANGRFEPYLTPDELENLTIRKGSLKADERKIIENHATVTRKMLENLPFPKRLANVPKYAAGHHEKLDGSGYPDGICGKDLPIQARIMALADIFEALTAKDRPYKKPMNLSQALKVMEFMKKDGHIDPELHDLFIREKIHFTYAKSTMNPQQVDVAE